MKGRKSIPDLSKSSRCSDHSWRNIFAPVKEPSPPITTRFVMPLIIIFLVAFRRPDFSKNSIHLAEPITVPPWKQEKIWKLGTSNTNLNLSWINCEGPNLSNGYSRVECYLLWKVVDWRKHWLAISEDTHE